MGWIDSMPVVTNENLSSQRVGIGAIYHNETQTAVLMRPNCKGPAVLLYEKDTSYETLQQISCPYMK
jgi:hypothetical protein